MKKSVIFVFLFIIMLSALVSAQFYDGGYGSWYSGFSEFFGSFFNILFGSEFMFEILLFFLIILSVSYVALERVTIFKDNLAARWVVTLAVSFLATRLFNDYTWVKFVLFPYNLLGVVLLSIIPFIIFFVFIESFESSTIRKIGWALYIVAFVALWYTSSSELGELSNIYLFTAVVGLIMIAADKHVRAMILRGAIQRGLTPKKTEQMIDLQDRIEKNLERLKSARGNQADIIKRQIINDRKNLIKLSHI